MTDPKALLAAYGDDNGNLSAYSAGQLLDQMKRDHAASQAAERAAATTQTERSALAVLEQYKGMTREQATAKLAELSADREYMARYLNGGAAERREMNDLQEIKISGPTAVDTLMDGSAAGISLAAPGIPNRDVIAMVEEWRTSGISDDTIRHTLENRPVTQAEHDEARRFRDRRLADPEWVKRMTTKHPEAMRELELMSIILASPIKAAA